MRLMKILFPVLMALLMLSVPLLSGCEPEEAVDTVLSGQSVFVGEWKMTRVSITPELPVPDLIIGMFLRGSPTWKITGNPDTGLASKISFDGRETWFIVPRLGISDLTIDARLRQVVEKSGSEMSAPGGGTIKVARVSLIGLPEFTNVIVNYQDSIDMTIGYIDERKDVVNADAVLRLQVTGGSYTMDGQTKPITPYSATVTYTGVRPRR